MKKFALIGASGYIAPRHFKAIKGTGNTMLAAYDPFDSVGVIDSYFPKADFFTEFERFDRHLDKLKRSGENIDYVSVCSPNYLHDSHIRFGLKTGANVISEKPLVLNPWNFEGLLNLEKETGNNVFNILQLRLHDSIIALKKRVDEAPKDNIFDFDLTYITSRGKWYYTSWKGDIQKSGGIATNIGVYFFDMLSWVFGDVKKNVVHVHTHDRAAGYFEFERARVRCILPYHLYSFSVLFWSFPLLVKWSSMIFGYKTPSWKSPCGQNLHSCIIRQTWMWILRDGFGLRRE
jgi:UDP-N-acetyl-2-amino-2-deoxyglucuronate dehydrogenase